MKTNTIFFILLAIMAGCSGNINTKEIDKQNLSTKINIFKDKSKNTLGKKASAQIIKITPDLFSELKSKKTTEIEKPERISDFQRAQLLLNKRIVLKTDEDRIVKIVLKEGKEVDLENDECYFVAYFPSEDILLLEGGHMSDVSYNLTTGESIEEVGNPDYMIHSPSKKFRLNGSFSGQECMNYFIQENMGGKFKKILSVNELFSNTISKDGLCYFKNSFWSNDSTFNFLVTKTNDDSEIIEKGYYQLKIN